MASVEGIWKCYVQNCCICFTNGELCTHDMVIANFQGDKKVSQGFDPNFEKSYLWNRIIH